MAQEAKDKKESQSENHSEKVDNRLPYEPPTLRKHGKVSNTTQNLPIPTGEVDSIFSFPFAVDVS